MNWQLHSLSIAGHSNSPEIAEQWRKSFASLPPANSRPDVQVRLQQVEEMPDAPGQQPDFSEAGIMDFYVNSHDIIVHFPRFGQLRIDPGQGETEGWLMPAAAKHPGIIEDFLATGLSPHLRQSGMYLIHAFAAAVEDRAVLLVGGIGAGKTTTGMALVDAGWRLIANDSPIIDNALNARQYPGLLAAYPDTYSRFMATRHLAANKPPEKKIALAAESIWQDVWQTEAAIAAILFPKIENREQHYLTALSPVETMQRLMPHTMERWDRANMQAHLALISRLSSHAPGYILHLGTDTETIPATVSDCLRASNVLSD